MHNVFDWFARWLNHLIPEGVYRGPFRRFVSWCDKHLSLNVALKRRVRRALGYADESKTPEWVSEVYQLISIGSAITLLILARYVPAPITFIVGLIALYRPFEIFLFALSWVFVHHGSVHSYKRSLVGFLINLVEVIFFYAAIYLAFGCISGAESVSTALYSSVRISVTIGPFGMAEPPESPFCASLMITQIAVSYFLIIISVASVVGALRKRGQVGGKRA